MSKAKETKTPAGKAQSGVTPRARARVRRRDLFIAKLAETCNVSEACKAAGWSRETAYRRKKNSQAFAALWEEALEIAKDGVYAEVRRRAIEGIAEPVFQKGKQVGTIRRYSDKLLLALAGAHDPRFRENAPSNTVNVSIAPQLDREQMILEAARNIAWIGDSARRIEHGELQPARLPAPSAVSPDFQAGGERPVSPATESRPSAAPPTTEGSPERSPELERDDPEDAHLAKAMKAERSQVLGQSDRRLPNEVIRLRKPLSRR